VKHSRLRPKSKKTAKEDRELAPIRRAYLVEFPNCMVCGQRSECVHEIASGTAGRAKSKAEPATWLATCVDCNCNKLTDKSEFPVKRQLAIKAVCDPKNFDMDKFNACYTLGRRHFDEVAEHLEWK
jgi:hypothetical protein